MQDKIPRTKEYFLSTQNRRGKNKTTNLSDEGRGGQGQKRKLFDPKSKLGCELKMLQNAKLY
jgi:hypothetical protein